jgi:hypothetical protein
MIMITNSVQYFKQLNYKGLSALSKVCELSYDVLMLKEKITYTHVGCA